MARGKPRIPPPPQKSRELLNRADTAATATFYEQLTEPIPRQQLGERVDAPTAEMRGPAPTNWGKVGAWIGVGTFSITLLITIIWNYADTVNSIRNLNSDVGDLKKKADDLFKTSVDAAARLSSLERRAQLEPSQVPVTQSHAASAPKR